MISTRRSGRPVFVLMAALAVLLSIPHEAALAALVETEAASVTVPGSGSDARARLMQWLARDEVRAALEEQGIDPSEAQARIRSLTDAEIARFSDALDRLPAGGGAIGLAIGVLLIVLLVVVILRVAGK